MASRSGSHARRIDERRPACAPARPKGPISWSLSIRVDGVRPRIAIGKGLGLAEARKAAEQMRAAIARGEAPAELAGPGPRAAGPHRRGSAR